MVLIAGTLIDLPSTVLVYFYDADELCCETVVVEGLEPPVTGIVVKRFIIDCLKEFNTLDENDSPRTMLWRISNEGSNIVCAFRLLNEENIISRYHFCFNHNIQNIIKDAIRTTPGMEKTIQTFQQNATIFSQSKNTRKALKDVYKTNNLPVFIPTVPNDTRWFGDLFMLEAFLKVEEGV